MPDPRPTPTPDPPQARRAGATLQSTPPRRSPALGRSPAGARPTPKPASAPPPKPPQPKASAEERERGRLLGLAAVGAATVIAVVVTIGIFVPAIGALIGGGVRPVDVGSLPETITVCDREYVRGTGDPGTLEAARALAAAEPVIVGVNGGCPEGVCVRASACLATVFVETTDGRYAAYQAGEST